MLLTEVYLSVILYNKEFSPHFENFSLIKNEFLFFLVSFTILIYTISEKELFINKIEFQKTLRRDELIIEFILFLSIICFSFFNLNDRFFIDYKLSIISRTPIEEFVLFIFVIIILLKKKSIFASQINLLILTITFAALGERYRMLIPLIALFLTVSNLKSSHIKFGFIPLYLFGLLIDDLRYSTDVNDYHITHFGSIVVSTSYISSVVENYDYLLCFIK